jgi:hypothetical protein
MLLFTVHCLVQRIGKSWLLEYFELNDWCLPYHPAGLVNEETEGNHILFLPLVFTFSCLSFTYFDFVLMSALCLRLILCALLVLAFGSPESWL